ncbi:nuclear transport factor 2 family protein [Flavobacterium sp. CYK-55]|uniref:nuclear transport factor 2 family protein n=1 Tax=Flavobacterium sp. CYK-55 TaxID=2835529 RepID=UPI001BD0D606|nr:nuclear transport factor 2 family protein [Flavobacterium sp. CYK-55]MBS7787736.1 nuclear transport factor 2 family protein [Flavobacterium sp. CYK-55]
MKKILFAVLLMGALQVNAQDFDKQEIRNTIETFFEGFHHRDTVLLHQVCADKLILQSIEENANGNKLTEEPQQFFYRSIASMPQTLKYNEQILGYTIQVDGSMGHAWTPYEFYLNGKLSHKGVNAFTLFKEKDRWKIVYIIDTRRK